MLVDILISLHKISLRTTQLFIQWLFLLLSEIGRSMKFETHLTSRLRLSVSKSLLPWYLHCMASKNILNKVMIKRKIWILNKGFVLNLQVPIQVFCVPRQLRRYRDSLRTGRYGIESRLRENFRTSPDRAWGQPSLLYNGYRVSPGGKERPWRDADPHHF